MSTDPTAPTPEEAECVAFLKDSVKPTALPEDDQSFFTDATYLRFARARDGKKEKALKMLQECVQWRQSYHPNAVTAKDVDGVFGVGTVFVAGKCREGRPVLYLNVGLPNTFDADHRVKLLVYLLEATMRRNWERLTWVVDFSQLGKGKRDDHTRETRKQTMHILQNYYPERLGALYLVNTPWYFRAVLAVVWPFLDTRTKKKIHVVPKEDLTKFIDSSELLTSLGGTREVLLTKGVDTLLSA